MAIQELQFKKVTTMLDEVLTPNTVYMYPDSDDTSKLVIAVTDSQGTAFKQTTTVAELDAINARIQSILDAGNATIVSTYADLMAIVAGTENVVKLVYVLDATGDTTVSSGAASYLVNPNSNTIEKLSEFESLDMISTWANLEDKPMSAVADIDDAVAKRHTHANKATLDLLADASGKLTYNGVPVVSIDARW